MIDLLDVRQFDLTAVKLLIEFDVDSHMQLWWTKLYLHDKCPHLVAIIVRNQELF